MTDEHEAERLAAVKWHKRSLRIKNALRDVLHFVGLNHAAAAALLSLHGALESKSLWPRGTIQTIKEVVERLPSQIFRLAGDLDEQAPCPYCGKPEALIHLAVLKTYCYACSWWGHDPRVEVKVFNRRTEATGARIIGITVARDIDGDRVLVEFGRRRLWFDVRTGDAEGNASLCLDPESRERIS